MSKDGATFSISRDMKEDYIEITSTRKGADETDLFAGPVTLPFSRTPIPWYKRLWRGVVNQFELIKEEE